MFKRHNRGRAGYSKVSNRLLVTLISGILFNCKITARRFSTLKHAGEMETYNNIHKTRQRMKEAFCQYFDYC